MKIWKPGQLEPLRKPRDVNKGRALRLPLRGRLQRAMKTEHHQWCNTVTVRWVPSTPSVPRSCDRGLWSRLHINCQADDWSRGPERATLSVSRAVGSADAVRAQEKGWMTTPLLQVDGRFTAGVRERSDQHESLRWTQDVSTRSLQNLPGSAEHSWTGALERRLATPAAKDSRQAVGNEARQQNAFDAQKSRPRRHITLRFENLRYAE